MNYKTMTIKDIMRWCVENGETAWLKAEAAQLKPYKKYPKIMGEDGKMHADKSRAPMIEMKPISFMQIKQDFCLKFMPDIIPHKEEKPTMYDLIKQL